MMNKKILQIILFVAVIIIWGLVLYKYFQGEPESEVAWNTPTIHSRINRSGENENAPLKLSYSDPFLKEGSGSKNNTTQTQNRISPPATNKKKTEIRTDPGQGNQIKWLDLTYKGSIQNKNNAEQIAIVSLNNTEKIVQEGDLILDYRVIKITNESILMEHPEGQTKEYKASGK